MRFSGMGFGSAGILPAFLFLGGRRDGATATFERKTAGGTPALRYTERTGISTMSSILISSLIKNGSPYFTSIMWP
jgi:hypothetical protein